MRGEGVAVCKEPAHERQKQGVRPQRRECGKTDRREAEDCRRASFCNSTTARMSLGELAMLITYAPSALRPRLAATVNVSSTSRWLSSSSMSDGTSGRLLTSSSFCTHTHTNVYCS